MKPHVGITVLVFAALCGWASCGQEGRATNDLVRTMLGPLLVRLRLSGDRIVRMPRAEPDQAVFFGGDARWTEARSEGRSTGICCIWEQRP